MELVNKCLMVPQQEKLHRLLGREKGFYLTTHSTHFIYGYMRRTFGKGPFSERVNPLPLLHGHGVTLSN